MLASVGYFFSNAISAIIGDMKQLGIALFGIAAVCIIAFYLVERFLLSQKIEEADPETIHRIEETIHDIEEKLHLTSSQSPNRKDKKTEKTETAANTDENNPDIGTAQETKTVAGDSQ